MESVGETIDRFQLVTPIGSGSFSVVWLANQLAPMRREVALKIVKPGLDVRTIAQRFDTERDVLARLEHPNISRIYDAGIHRSGRPYFVMELVRGESITRFVSAHGLCPGDMASLMIDVCSAVSFAHARGLVHRDLKPANILVQFIDGKPTPKLIDFGIARILTPDRAGTHTLGVIPAGTPAYMSPEQATFGDVDARADVYSLGVVLLELLTGDAMSHDRSDRAIHAAMAAKSLGGDWAVVVQRAIAADSADRYATPEQFAADLQQIIGGGKPLARRRSSRSIRRIAVAFAAAILCGVIVWMLVSRGTSVVTTPSDIAWPVPVSMKQLWRIQPEGNAGWWSIEIDAEARRAFAVSSTRELLEIDINTGDVVRTIHAEVGGDMRLAVRVALSTDMQRLIMVDESPDRLDQRLLVFDRAGNLISRFNLAGATYAICPLDAGATKVAVSTLDGSRTYVAVYDVTSGRRIAMTPAWNSTFAPVYLVAHPDGNSLYTISPAGEIVRISASTGKVIATLGHADPSTAVLRLLDDHRFALTGHYGATIFDVTTQSPIIRLSSPHKTIGAMLDIDDTIQLSTVDHRITRYSVTTAAPIASLDLGGDLTQVEFPHHVPGTSSFLVASQDGSLRLMSPEANASDKRPVPLGQ